MIGLHTWEEMVQEISRDSGGMITPFSVGYSVSVKQGIKTLGSFGTLSLC